MRGYCLRVVVELPGEAVELVREHAERLVAHVAREELRIPILLHGEECSAWTALGLAVKLSPDTWIGLEECLTLPDGMSAPDNAALVRAARGRMPNI